jgi:hypothetical protein
MRGSMHSPLDDIPQRRWLGLPLALVLGGLLVGVLLAVLPASAAPAVAYPCSQAGLNSALAAGGAATFSCLAPTTVTVSSAPKLVNKNVSLDGGNKLILSGGGITGVFTVAAGVHLNLFNLTVRDAQLGTGAGVYNNGFLAVTHTNFISTQAGLGAAVFNAPGATTIITDSHFEANLGKGAVLWNGPGFISSTRPATMTMANSTYLSNSAGQGGAMVNALGLMTVSGSQFTSNTADFGGAIFNQSQLQVSNSQFTGNSAGTVVAAQAQRLARPALSPANGTGGAIANDTGADLVIGLSSFADNVATQDGGAISNEKFGLVSVASSAFTHNTAENDSGGAVANLGVFSVTESLFTRNYGAPHLGDLTGGGGAIFSYDGPLFALLAPGHLNGAGDARQAQVP